MHKPIPRVKMLPLDIGPKNWPLGLTVAIVNERLLEAIAYEFKGFT